MRWHPRIRRLARISGIVLAVVFGFVLLALGSLLLRPARERVLEHVLSIVADSLPGTLETQSAHWPALSRLELRGVTWVDGPTSLAAADRIFVDLDLGALMKKDLHVRALALDGVSADVPLITARFPADEKADGGGPPSFPRGGSLPWTPSIGVDSLRITLDRLTAAADLSFAGSLSAGIELRADHAPGIDLRALDASWLERGFAAHSDGMRASISSGEFEGGLRADLGPEVGLVLALSSDAERHFRMDLTEAGSGANAGLRVDGSFTQAEGGRVTEIGYEALLRTPPATRIEELLGRPGALRQLEPLGIVELDARAKSTSPDPCAAGSMSS